MLKHLFYCVLAMGCICLSGGCATRPFDAYDEEVLTEKRSSEAVQKYIKHYQNGRFTYISNGSSCLSNKLLFKIWVTAKTQETIQSGRALAFTFVKDYVATLQNNTDSMKSYVYSCNRIPTRYSGAFGLKDIGVRIAFWDENVDRPKAPYLAEIDFYNNKFWYYEADPETQALRLVLEESYEDATKQLDTA